MNNRNQSFIIYLPALIYLLFGLASLWPFETMWGINHLSFLPFGSSAIFYAGLVLMAILYIMPANEKLLEKFENSLSSLAADSKKRLIIALIFSLIFYLLRMETHFLGDGYSWLSILGQGETSFHKFSEPGSIYFVRWIQSMLGGYTEATARITFQLLSIISGGIVVYNIFLLTSFLKRKGLPVCLSLASLFFSGHLLLYFGYVEFYPLSWAVNLVFINLSLIYLENKKWLAWVVVVYLFSVAIHIQALYFLPALIYLIIIKFNSDKIRKTGFVLLSLGAVVGGLFLVWLYKTELAFEVLILPLFEGRAPAENYTIFSMVHFFDILNLILLVFPGMLVLLIGRFSSRFKFESDEYTLWLLILSGGALSFLLFYGAAITMAFDWDIMSLTLMPLMLLLLYISRKVQPFFNSKFIFSYFILTIFMSGSFIYANINAGSSEVRFHSLLNENHRSSWVGYADYYKRNNDQKKYLDVISEMNQKFPGYVALAQAYDLISRKKYDTAFGLADELFRQNKYNADYSQLLGNLYGKKQMYDSAEYFYNRAIKLKPYNTGIQNELGQLYLRQGKNLEAIEIFKKAKSLTPKVTSITESMAVLYLRQNNLDSAKVLADELFQDDPDSPGGHLILLSIALHRGDELTATFHYNMFLKFGLGRSDYKSIFEYYNYLNQRHLK